MSPIEVWRNTLVLSALYWPAGDVRGVAAGVELPEGVAVGDGVVVAVGVGLWAEGVTATGVFWLSITIATASTAIMAMTPTIASILFRLRALTVEGLVLRYGRELMPTNITQILFKHISKSSNYRNKKEKQENGLN